MILVEYWYLSLWFITVVSLAVSQELSWLKTGLPLLGQQHGNEIHYETIASEIPFEIVLNTQNQSIDSLEFLTDGFSGVVRRDLSPVIIRVFHIFPKTDHDEWLSRAARRDWGLLSDRSVTGYKRLTFSSGKSIAMAPFLSLGEYFVFRGFFALRSIILRADLGSGNDVVMPDAPESSTQQTVDGPLKRWAVLWVIATAIMIVVALSYTILRIFRSKRVSAITRKCHYEMVDLPHISSPLRLVPIGGYRSSPDSPFDQFLLGVHDPERGCIAPVCIVGSELPEKDIQGLNRLAASQMLVSESASLEDFKQPDVWLHSNLIWKFNVDEIIAEADRPIPIKLLSPRWMGQEPAGDLHRDVTDLNAVLARARPRDHAD